MDYQEAIKELENKLHNKTELEEIPEWVLVIVKTINYHMKELIEYKDLGSLEEIQEAVEKQKVKKVTDINGDILKFGTCPCCKKRILTVEGGNYCEICGQRVDWGDALKEYVVEEV